MGCSCVASNGEMMIDELGKILERIGHVVIELLSELAWWIQGKNRRPQS
jgi:hypothetical protein